MEPAEERSRGVAAVCPVPPGEQDAKVEGIIQLLLAEKRTSLAVLRTGVTVGLIPLSVTTVLVSLSRFYDWADNLHFLLPMYALLTFLTGVSFYLVVRSIYRIRQQDKLIESLRREYPSLAPFLDCRV